LIALKVGLGVSLGIRIPLVLIAGIWIGLKVVKHQKASNQSTASETALMNVPGVHSYHIDAIKPVTGTEIYEAPYSEQPHVHELGTDRR
jgi:hypothetical protein